MRITKIAARILVIAGVIVLGLGVYRVWDPFAGSRQHAAQQRLYPLTLSAICPFNAITWTDLTAVATS